MIRASVYLLVWSVFGLSPLYAQGIPVFDPSAFAKQVEQIAQLTQQLSTMKQQLSQLESLKGALTGFNTMGSMSTSLDSYGMRQALPNDFGGVEQLLNGNGSGNYGTLSKGFVDNNARYTPPGDTYYEQAVRDAQVSNAGEQTLGQSMYDAASKRMDGISQLRDQISQSSDVKNTLDLSARLQVELAYLQLDMLRMQSLQMVQTANEKVQREKDKEQALANIEAFSQRVSQK